MSFRDRIAAFRDRVSSRADLPDRQQLAELAVASATAAAAEGLRGEEAGVYAAAHFAEGLEPLIQGNPEHLAGRIIEQLDDQIPLLVEVGYLAFKAGRAALT